jgi:hypothetical protein
MNIQPISHLSLSVLLPQQQAVADGSVQIHNNNALLKDVPEAQTNWIPEAETLFAYLVIRQPCSETNTADVLEPAANTIHLQSTAATIHISQISEKC